MFRRRLARIGNLQEEQNLSPAWLKVEKEAGKVEIKPNPHRSCLERRQVGIYGWRFIFQP